MLRQARKTVSLTLWKHREKMTYILGVGKEKNAQADFGKPSRTNDVHTETAGRGKIVRPTP